MLRLVLTSACLFAGGCVSILNVGTPPTDKDAAVVEEALTRAVITSCEQHVRGDGWQAHCVVRGTTGRSSFIEGRNDRETKWSFEFACAKPDSPPSSPVGRLPTGDYTRLLTPIRADVLAALEVTGVEVSWASPVEVHDENRSQARFEIRYLRHRQTVAGEVIGTIEPSVEIGGPDSRYTVMNVTLREWTCK